MAFVLPGVVRIPAGNSFLEGAMLEPVNTVLKAINRLSLLPEDFVLVIGQGPIGLMFTRMLALRGLSVVASDLLPARLKLARKFGAKLVLRADERSFRAKAMAMTRGRGFDGAVVTVPSDAAVRQAQELVRGAGKVLLFAHTRRGDSTDLDLSAVCLEEKDLIGSYSSDVTLQGEVAALVFGRKCDVRGLITHEFPLEQTEDAIRLASRPAGESLKVVIVQEDGPGRLRRPRRVAT
jgi:L-iditol 2-dehydrogenase